MILFRNHQQAFRTLAIYWDRHLRVVKEIGEEVEAVKGVVW
jgi:hypothetical protein